LFLNEIDVMSLSVQAKLLRFLDEKRFRHVGGLKDIEVDVRVITATNQSLSLLIEKEKFRKDLYYRISIVDIHLPPLRERGKDVLLIAEYYMDKFCGLHEIPHKKIAPDAKAILLCQQWEGNIRELVSVIQRLVKMCKSEIIGKNELLEQLESDEQKDAFLQNEGKFLSLQKAKEKQHILKALILTEGNKIEAAKLLRIRRNTLYKKLQKYEIDLSSDDG